MKDQILKIAKVKSEKEFYKKYPSEEAFMAKHGKAFKKAAMGKTMVYDQLNQLTSWDNPAKAQDGGNWANYGIPAMSTATYDKATGLVNNASGVVSKSDTTALGFDKSAPGGGSGSGFSGAAFAQAGLQGIGQIVGGIEAIGAQKKARQKARQSNELGKLALQAQQPGVKTHNKYVTPYDNPIQSGQLGNPYGSNTNYLTAQNGTMIGGNPTEIQNTYAPTGDLYRDLGYQPLTNQDSKQYKKGGRMLKAEFGDYFADSGEAQIGSAVGGAIAAGFGLPPELGQLGGKVLTNVLGIGRKGAQESARLKQEGEAIQGQLAFNQNNTLGASRKNGGWVSNDWQPQTFTKFGDYSAKQLLAPPHDADMLRAGGTVGDDYYTPPSAAALSTERPELRPLTMDTGGRLPYTNMMFDTDKYPRAKNGVQYAMGGDLQVGDGGYAETLSYNPNLPGGEIGMFRGASHDNGGIQTQYGENGVEVEGGEPFTVLKGNGLEDGNVLENGGAKENLVVFGNIKINKNIANLMGDKKAEGMKFKTYIADVAKNDAKQLKTINKGLDLIEQYNGNSSYDRLGMNSGMANLMGGQAWQKINANKIKEAGIVQDAIHQTANELGAKSDKLAEGKIERETDPSMMGKNGKKLSKAQKGWHSDWEDFQGDDGLEEIDPITREQIRRGIPVPAGLPGSNAANVLPEFTIASSKKPKPNLPEPFTKSEGKTKVKGKGINWKKIGDVADTVLSNAEPWLRPSNANEALNPDQLIPEYYALGNNQLEAVQAQKYQPMLGSPMDISLNDQINAVDSQARLAALNAGQNNPAAQAQIMAQALEAKNRILGEQTRINQANKMGVYDKNRDILNDAQLKNLQILDQQYVRQAQAKSNTKEQTFAALSSIAAKTAQQRAANRKLAVMENLYGFRFSPSGRAYNANMPYRFNMSGNPFNRSALATGQLAEGYEDVYNNAGQRVGTRRIPTSQKDNPSLGEISDFLGKNGTKVSKKNARNSSIVKALKNL